MRTIKHISFAIVLALTTIMTSCSSSDGGGGGSSAGAGTIKAKVGGVNFTSMAAGTFANRQSSMLAIQGSDASGKVIQLIVMNGGAVGTYQISNDASIVAVGSYTDTNLSNPSATQTFAAPYENSGVAGSITITEITATNVKGTFTFTGKDENSATTKQITNGSFNVPFQN